MLEYKELLGKFKALTIDEQKDMLFTMLDAMDVYERKYKSLKTKKARELYDAKMAMLNILVRYFIEDTDLMNEYGVNDRDVLLTISGIERRIYENGVASRRKEA